MESNENVVETLNDLIRINNDRIEGYKKAARESDDQDVDMRGMFHRMADESKQYLSELTSEVIKLGGTPAEGTTTSGKIYRVWMDIKAKFSGHDRATVLANCEFGEDAAQKSYQQALSDESLSVDVRQLVANQKASLQISHDTIQKFREMYSGDGDLSTNDRSSRAASLGSQNLTTSTDYQEKDGGNDVTTGDSGTGTLKTN